ncbi:MAG: hypothetical protein K2Y51_08045 [Gammaproteobacteria bacterium]|nr:hypothetical protein [Gammaproteobacteria bacterium]
MRPRSRSRVATACIVVAVGGLIGAIAPLSGVAHGALVWPLTCFLAGGVLGGSRTRRNGRLIKRAALAASFLPPTALGLPWAHWLAERMATPRPKKSLVSMPRDGHPAEIESLSTLLPLTFVTYVAATLAVLIGALLIAVATSRAREALKLGPERYGSVYRALLIGVAGIDLLLIAQVLLLI